MHRTNEAYDHDADLTSSEEQRSNGKRRASSESIQPIPDDSNVDQTPKSVDQHEESTSEENPAEKDTNDPPESPPDDDPYYSLEHLREKRHGKREDDANLPRRVKRFYKKQDALIDVYERVHTGGENGESKNEEYKLKLEKIKKQSKILTNVSLVANIGLFILKIVGAVISKSLSVVSSVIDSAVDLTTSVILFWAWRKIKNRDTYLYPQGRTRLEPIAIVILSVIMCAASVLVIYESINTITNDAGYFTEVNTTKTLGDINMSAFPISTMVVTIVCKAVLYFFCFRVKTPTTSALASDHINDVVSNIVALFCGLIGSYAYENKINQKAIVIDPIGAIVISIYIIITWIRQANGQIKRLSGYTADPQFLSQLTWIVYHHSPEILKIDTVRAFHSGTSFLVEVDIVLPEAMPLKDAHDIGESLQKKLEDLPEVERAFVHMDYEYDHNPTREHKIV